jgi:hypothetical protein
VTETFIHHTKRTKNFTQIDNGIRAAGLSIPALGLLVYLLTLPPDWRIHCDQIMGATGLGWRPFWRHWNELKRAGYILVRRERGSDGRFGEPDIHVYDEPHLSHQNAHSGEHLSHQNPHSGESRVTKIHTLENGDDYKEETGRNTRQVQKTESEEETPSSQIFSKDTAQDNHHGKSESATGSPSPRGESECVEIGGLEIPAAKFATWVQRFAFLPDVGAEIEALAPWVINERMPKNGGDWEGPLVNALNNKNREIGLERNGKPAEKEWTPWGGYQ